jgi:hypothetical protein
MSLKWLACGERRLFEGPELARTQNGSPARQISALSALF